MHATDPNLHFGAEQFRDAYDTGQALRQSNASFRAPEAQQEWLALARGLTQT